MAKINHKVLVADSNYLTCKGLGTLVSEMDGFDLVSESFDYNELREKLLLYSPDVVIIDFSTETFTIDALLYIKKNYPQVQIMAVTPQMPPGIMAKALNSGVISYILKDCGKEEMIEALTKTVKGERFLCGKIVDYLINKNLVSNHAKTTSSVACEGLNITGREMEIIKYIAEGYSNKEIANKLCLSTHTVTTHRKNIMSKLEVNNTAGVVMFAVRENLLSPNKFLFS
ncbi:MAG: response regulator transcription factor [Bacteroidia bacterium]|nr:response regulator transcription factor [Bacteroidia bacterium]